MSGGKGGYMSQNNKKDMRSFIWTAIKLIGVIVVAVIIVRAIFPYMEPLSMNETYTTESGISYTFKNITGLQAEKEIHANISEGEHFVCIQVNIENNSTSSVDYSYLNWHLCTFDEKTIYPTILKTDSELSEGILKPGKLVSGYIYYACPIKEVNKVELMIGHVKHMTWAVENK